jgi:hypothetical protein
MKQLILDILKDNPMKTPSQLISVVQYYQKESARVIGSEIGHLIDEGMISVHEGAKLKVKDGN